VAEAVGSPIPQRCDGIRILLVEDDADSREILAQTLTAEGATVTAVSTAAEALPLVASADIIVTDYAFPREDAVWLLERVNKQPSPSRSSW
jgi:CheY-like chemotaxis protein